MEADIEVKFSLHKIKLSLSNLNKLTNYYDLVDLDKEKDVLHISKEYELINLSLSEAIIDFFKEFEGINELSSNFEILMRVGLFYYLKETMVCPVILNNECINILSRFNVGIDIIGYPCNEEK
jgi:hypothetical protein